MDGFDWADELREGEELLWQGEPVPTLRPWWDDLPLVFVGLCLLAISAVAVAAGRWGVLAIALPLGLYFGGGQELLAAKALSSSTYALTSQRALIVSGWPRRHLTSIELRHITCSDLVMDRERQQIGSISFQKRAHLVGRGEPFHAAAPAFRLIADPEPLLPIIRGELRLPKPGDDPLKVARHQQRLRKAAARVRGSARDS